MLSIRVMKGDCATYYTQNIQSEGLLEVSQKEIVDEKGVSKIVNYYTNSGDPQGVWFGKGLNSLKIDGFDVLDSRGNRVQSYDNSFPDSVIKAGDKVSKEQFESFINDMSHPNTAVLSKEMVGLVKVNDFHGKARVLKNIRRTLSLVSRREVAKIERIKGGEVVEAKVLPTVEGWKYRFNIDGEELKGRENRKGELELFLGRKKIRGSFVFDEEGKSGYQKIKLDGKLITPVKAIDFTFSAPKSVSILAVLGTDDLSSKVIAAHESAVSKALEYLEENSFYTRIGSSGAMQVDTTGMRGAKFLQINSRNNDPQLHTHCVVGNSVVDRVTGKKVRPDSRALFKDTVTASDFYNQCLKIELEKIGLKMRVRDMGINKQTVLEVDGVEQELIDFFSSRRKQTVERAEQLINGKEKAFGRSLTRQEEYEIFQQATLDTRSPSEKHLDWDELFKFNVEKMDKKFSKKYSPDSITKTVLKKGKIDKNAESILDVDIDEVVKDVLDKVAKSKNTWGKNIVRNEAMNQLKLYKCDSVDLFLDKVNEVTDLVLSDCVKLPENELLNDVPELFRRADGSSMFRSFESSLYTTWDHWLEEVEIFDSAHLSMPARIDPNVVEQVKLLSADYQILNEGQRGLIDYLVNSNSLLTVAEAPAGTGKTTAMKAFSDMVVESNVPLYAIGPTAKSYLVMQEDLNSNATFETIDRFLLTGAKPGSVVLIDEAGMANTEHFYKLVKFAKENNIMIKALGDSNQLAPVGRGGIFSYISRQNGDEFLKEVMRFKTASGEKDYVQAANSIMLRSGNKEAIDLFFERNLVVEDRFNNIKQLVSDKYLDTLDSGKTIHVMSDSNKMVAEVNEIIAEKLRVLRGVDFDKVKKVTLADENKAVVGDKIITRENVNKFEVKEMKPIFNYDSWTIEKIKHNGEIEAVSEDGKRKVTLTKDYIEKNTQLGYATTVHGAQGITVDVAVYIPSGNSNNNLIYVGLTRGRETNWIYFPKENVANMDRNELSDRELTVRELLEKRIENTTNNLTLHEQYEKEARNAGSRLPVEKARRGAYFKLAEDKITEVLQKYDLSISDDRLKFARYAVKTGFSPEEAVIDFQRLEVKEAFKRLNPRNSEYPVEKLTSDKRNVEWMKQLDKQLVSMRMPKRDIEFDELKKAVSRNPLVVLSNSDVNVGENHLYKEHYTTKHVESRNLDKAIEKLEDEHFRRESLPDNLKEYENKIRREIVKHPDLLDEIPMGHVSQQIIKDSPSVQSFREGNRLRQQRMRRSRLSSNKSRDFGFYTE